jgi:threonine/homoserine efflux transporter RhtA
VATALLIEYLAPLLLVGFTWATTRRVPRATVLLGSVLAVGGLILVIGPGALRAADPVGLATAFAAAIGCAAYFVIAARPADGLPPVALAGSGLILGGLALALVAATGVLPFRAALVDLPLLGATRPWWVPLLVVAVIGTALAYATGIAASARLGSRLASFVGLLEVVFAALFAWVLLGEALTPLQLLGGVLILGGIAAVPAEQPPPPASGQGVSGGLRDGGLRRAVVGQDRGGQERAADRQRAEHTQRDLLLLVELPVVVGLADHDGPAVLDEDVAAVADLRVAVEAGEGDHDG